MKPSAVDVPADSRIVVETPGSGGYGPASERDPAAIEADRRSQKFSEGFLVRNYPQPD